ncbi:BatA and WFA domain-containing protein [Cohnella faecalis]|uniref:vWA domain-containing protein n=1 Tax=Cohnella faecalis TaxID=2315694 RepID=UPI001314DE55|nr:BatA and WFA domain-containing protein [Cohnella faecalis]
MFFQSLASLWFALSLPLIALMYILKKKYTDTQIASSLLWRRTLREQEANRPWQRLRRQLLLAMQLLVAALLVLALTGPYLRGAAANGSRHIAVVLDNSASMTALTAEGGGTVFEQAKHTLRDWLSEQASSMSVTLLTTGADPEVVVSGQSNGKELLEAIDRIPLNFGNADVGASLSLADAILRNQTDGEIRLYTDGRLRSASLPATASPLKVVQLDGVANNTAIAGFGVRQLTNEDGQSAVVTLINRGASAQSGSLKVEAAAEADVDADNPYKLDYTLQPGEQRSYTVDKLTSAEYYRASIAASDGYAADNVAFAFPSSGGEERRALLVGHGNLFLDKALQLAGVKTVWADPERVEPDEELAKAIDWVILDGGDENKIRSLKGWERLLSSKPIWRIWSAESPPANGKAATPDSSGPVVRDHPVTRYLTFGETHISRLVKADSFGLGDSVVTYGGVPAIYAGKSDGKPGIVFAFDLHDSDLPLRSEFPILIGQAADWMSGGMTASLGQSVANERIDLQHHLSANSAEWVPVRIEDSYENENTNPKQAVRLESGSLSSEQPAPAVPGLYKYAEYDESKQLVASRLLSVVSAPEEGELRLNSDPANALPIGPSTTGTHDIDQKSADYRKSIIPWIAALLLLLMAAEWGVYRRGTAI